MIHVQALGKRKAHAISDTGVVCTDPLGRENGEEVTTSALTAVRSTRSSSSMSSREKSAIAVKKAVIEMHNLLDVVFMLRNGDILSTQRCSRPLATPAVGMLEKCTTDQAVAFKSRAFQQGVALLERAEMESSRAIDERRAYTLGCKHLKQHWNMKLQKPAAGAPAHQRTDVVSVDCSFSSCGGKYSGSSWSDVLSISSEGPVLQKHDVLSPQYTIEASISDKSGGTVVSQTLWNLLQTSSTKERSRPKEFDDIVEDIELEFARKSHDCFCREIFDNITQEALDSAVHAQVAAMENFEMDIKSFSWNTILDDDFVSQLQIVHFSRLKISFLLTKSSVLSIRLVELSDYAECTEQSKQKYVREDVNSSSTCHDALKTASSVALLTLAYRKMQQWREDRNALSANNRDKINPR